VHGNEHSATNSEPGEHSRSGPPGRDDDVEALRQAFERLPKVAGHGVTALERHDSIRPEWIMQVIAEPFERYEIRISDGERRTIITGRVPQSSQWIMVVFIGDPETGRFLTAYHNKHLARRYGGRPWPST
jgi:hypothetical protein